VKPVTSMTPEEAADRVAIRALIDAYAHCADRRDADGQMALFTADTHFVVYIDARSSEPSMELHSRAELAPVFDDLNRYVATTHFNGQSTVTISGAAATGESYCLGAVAGSWRSPRSRGAGAVYWVPGPIAVSEPEVGGVAVQEARMRSRS
jgi:hypothetical protein